MESVNLPAVRHNCISQEMSGCDLRAYQWAAGCQRNLQKIFRSGKRSCRHGWELYLESEVAHYKLCTIAKGGQMDQKCSVV